MRGESARPAGRAKGMDGVPDDRVTRPRLATPLLALALAAALAVPAGEARAAGDLGFKIGEAGRLHLSLELAGQYDTNIFYSSVGTATGGWVVDVIPGFDMQVAGNTASLDLKGALDAKQYVTSVAKDLSRVFGTASLGAGLNRHGAIGLELTDAFAHSDQTPSLSVAQTVISNHNDLQLQVPLRPGGGALQLTLGGQWVKESFEQYVTALGCDPAINPTCVPGNIGAYGYNQYGGSAEVRWRFLPRTALVLDGNYFQRSPDDLTVSRKVRGARGNAGLAGLVTTRLAVTLKGGWGTAFDSPGFTYSTWLANVELQYVTQGPVGAKIGYLHDFRADPGTDYAVYSVDRAYLEGRLLIGGRLTLRATASWDALKYVINGVTSNVISLVPAVDYELLRWVYVGASYTLTSRSTGQLPGKVPAFDYTRQLVGLRVVLAY